MVVAGNGQAMGRGGGKGNQMQREQGTLALKYHKTVFFCPTDLGGLRKRDETTQRELMVEKKAVG